MGGGGQHLLEVVQHQQHRARAQEDPKSLQHGPAARVGEAEGMGDGAQHEGRIADRGEVDQGHPIGELLGDLSNGRQGQTGLAYPGRAGQCEQARRLGPVRA